LTARESSGILHITFSRSNHLEEVISPLAFLSVGREKRQAMQKNMPKRWASFGINEKIEQDIMTYKTGFFSIFSKPNPH
jgi:hypothetical protein